VIPQTKMTKEVFTL